MPGWLSWLERTAHRVIKQCSDLFLGYREIAGSNPAPGTYNYFYTILNILKILSNFINQSFHGISNLFLC